MTLQVDNPDTLVRQAVGLAKRQRVTVDEVVAAALSPQISAAPTHVTIAWRAKRVSCQQADEILARVSANPPHQGDEL